MEMHLHEGPVGGHSIIYCDGKVRKERKEEDEKNSAGGS